MRSRRGAATKLLTTHLNLAQVKKDKEDLTKQWGTTGILGTLEGHARGIQARRCW